jgi:O-antigen ligase
VLDRAPGWLDLPGLGRLTTSAHSVGTDSRFQLWSRAFHLWTHHPLFGIGIGQFGRYSSDILGTSPITGTGFIAHNTFLSFLAELGAFGFLLSVGGILSLTYIAARADHLDGAVRASLLIGILVLWAEMMTLNLQNVRYVWIFAGLLLGLCRPVIAHQSAVADVSSARNTGRSH